MNEFLRAMSLLPRVNVTIYYGTQMLVTYDADVDTVIISDNIAEVYSLDGNYFKVNMNNQVENEDGYEFKEGEVSIVVTVL